MYYGKMAKMSNKLILQQDSQLSRDIGAIGVGPSLGISMSIQKVGLHGNRYAKKSH